MHLFEPGLEPVQGPAYGRLPLGSRAAQTGLDPELHIGQEGRYVTLDVRRRLSQLAGGHQGDAVGADAEYPAEVEPGHGNNLCRVSVLPVHGVADAEHPEISATKLGLVRCLESLHDAVIASGDEVLLQTASMSVSSSIRSQAARLALVLIPKLEFF